MDDHDPRSSELLVARCIFLPLPVPLPIPHGTVLVEHDGEPKTADHLLGVRASTKIHQTTFHGSADLVVIERLLELGQRLLDADTEAKPATPAPTPQGDLTIAEVVVPAAAEGSEAESPLDIAINAVRRIQQAAMLVTQHAVPLLSRQRLPFFIPMYTQWLGAEGEVSSTGPALLAAIDTEAVQRLAPAKRPDVGIEELEAGLHQLAHRGPFMLATEMRAEAQASMYHYGDYRASVLALASSHEVLLDALLMSMLWEEGEDPSIGVQYFGSSGIRHKNKVLSQYAPRLKGSWQADRGAVGDYLKRVVYLRQRIMHAGHSPTEQEALDAHQAGVALEKHISARLRSAAIQKQYPRTAVLYCGPDRLERDGDLTGVARRLLDDAYEGLWFAQHARWADWAIRFTDPDPPIPGTSSQDLVVLIEFTRSSRRLIVHDARARAAAVPADADAWLVPDSEQAHALDALIAHEGPNLGDDEWRLVSLDISVNPELAVELAWQRDNELLVAFDHRLPHLRNDGPHPLPHQADAAT